MFLLLCSRRSNSSLTLYHPNSLAERRQRIEEKKAAWAAKRDAADE